MSAGTDDVEQFATEARAVLEEVLSMLIAKRTAYGPHNLTRFGGLGIVIRTSDKVARLAELYQSGAATSADGESIDDAWRDLCGYAVLGILHQRANRP